MKIITIILTHNYEQFLSDCIKSVLEQTRKPDKIVVVDDASDSFSAKDIAEKNKLEYLRLEFANPQKTRNHLADYLAKTGFDFASIIDADDWLAPNHYQRLEEELLKNEKLGMVWARIMHSFGPWFKVPFIKEGETKFIPQPIYNIPWQKVNSCCAASGILYRVKAIGCIKRDENYPTSFDWDVMLTMIDNGWKIKQIDDLFFHYRFHGRSLTKGKAELRKRCREYVAKKHNIQI